MWRQMSSRVSAVHIGHLASVFGTRRESHPIPILQEPTTTNRFARLKKSPNGHLDPTKRRPILQLPLWLSGR
jgi:hypothetical protein